MVRITNICLIIGGSLWFLAFIYPLIMKIIVNNNLEKRYKCKLNVEIENRRIFPLYSYFKYCNPGTTIAMAYIFNSKKMIDKNFCLSSINYNIKTAPKLEIFICVLCWILMTIALLLSTLYCILTQIFNFKS